LVSGTGIRVVVDRIEEGTAILLIGDSEARLDLPLALLPPGTREGSLLSLSFKLDEPATEQLIETVQARIERLKRLSRR
jgi:hypothetical protein